ncbi:DUF3108 domain-containing protein [Marinifilum sp. N1E240]|uniref:DUF3108 domain-containing protein n=1 Tax=Marinifilum sp. N1E240 TaxID=2608082 RepID=UPI00128B1AAE|nr:DUF3108 domain-containing protein [Marinifilum sp. N1E240]MPQ45438.1 DUF3108 domain-containing protein [Marinifilum sp. N1E240]
MIRFFLIIISVLFLSNSSFAELPIKSSNKGEHLKYVIHYGIIRGGKASLKLKTETHNNQEVFHATLTGKTVGFFNSLYKVKDSYQSYFKKETLLPYKAIRDIREGSYKRYNEVTFDREKNEITSQRTGTKPVPEGIHDILSAFYYARAYYFNKDLVEGQVIKIQTYFADEEFLLQFRFMGYETIKSKIGDIKCYKFIPIVETGRAFKDEDDMKIWVSADANKIPVRVQFDLFLGSLRCDLTNFSDFSLNTLINK